VNYDKRKPAPLQKHKRSTLDLLRITTDDKLESIVPSGPCRKCGKSQWARDIAPLTWSCLQCGNLLYIEFGKVTQQIDVILRSDRGKEYEQTNRGTIIPKCLP
jgi:ribosomal protein L37AE/L43A